MRINPRNVRRFQEGGPMPEEAMGPEAGGAPMGPEGGQDPIMQLAQMAMQALQAQDCQAAMAVCQGFVELLQSAQGQGGAPAEEAPAGEPVYRRGGTLVRRIRK